MAKRTSTWVRQPSWWVVIIAGTLCAVFLTAIIREVVSSHQVGQQVERLRRQVATEQQRHAQLQDLIDYLGSPTFQEQEARLKLGLQRVGEQVILVPPTNSNSPLDSGSSSLTTTATGQKLTHQQQWWRYFFGPRSTATTS